MVISKKHLSLSDVLDFVEATLAGEQLSRPALEQRTRLLTRASRLPFSAGVGGVGGVGVGGVGGPRRPSAAASVVDLYINMSSDPTLSAFFKSDAGAPSPSPSPPSSSSSPPLDGEEFGSFFLFVDCLWVFFFFFFMDRLFCFLNNIDFADCCCCCCCCCCC